MCGWLNMVGIHLSRHRCLCRKRLSMILQSYTNENRYTNLAKHVYIEIYTHTSMPCHVQSCAVVCSRVRISHARAYFRRSEWRRFSSLVTFEFNLLPCKENNMCITWIAYTYIDVCKYCLYNSRSLSLCLHLSLHLSLPANGCLPKWVYHQIMRFHCDCHPTWCFAACRSLSFEQLWIDEIVTHSGIQT